MNSRATTLGDMWQTLGEGFQLSTISASSVKSFAPWAEVVEPFDINGDANPHGVRRIREWISLPKAMRHKVWISSTKSG